MVVSSENLGKSETYRVDVTDGSPAGAPSWASNALRFGSYDEAETYARDLTSRWLAARAARVVREDVPERETVDAADPRIVVNYL